MRNAFLLALLLMSSCVFADDDITFTISNSTGKPTISSSVKEAVVYANSSVILNIRNDMNVSDEVSLDFLNVTIDTLYRNWTLPSGSTGRTFLKMKRDNETGILWVSSVVTQNQSALPVVVVRTISKPIISKQQKIELRAGSCKEMMVRINATDDNNVTICGIVSEDQLGFENVTSGKLNQTAMTDLQESIRDYINFLNKSENPLVCNETSTYLIPANDQLKKLMDDLSEKSDCDTMVQESRHEVVVYYQSLLQGCQDTRDAMIENNQSLTGRLSECLVGLDSGVGVYSRRLKECQDSMYNETVRVQDKVRSEEVWPWKAGALLSGLSCAGYAVYSHNKRYQR